MTLLIYCILISWLIFCLCFWFFCLLILLSRQFFIYPDCLFCTYVGIRVYFNEILLVCNILIICSRFLYLFLLFSSFTLLHSLDHLFSSCYHIIFRIYRVLPVKYLIDYQTSRWSYLTANTWWLNCTNNLMLELAHNCIWKVYYGSCSI